MADNLKLNMTLDAHELAVDELERYALTADDSSDNSSPAGSSPSGPGVYAFHILAPTSLLLYSMFQVEGREIAHYGRFVTLEKSRRIQNS
jgi:hypothetical protein